MNLPKTFAPFVKVTMANIMILQKDIKDEKEVARDLGNKRDMKKLADWEGKLDGCLNRLNEIEREL